MGTLLIALAIVILLEERWFAPWYPCLFLATTAACLLAARELVRMLDAAARPSLVVVQIGLFTILLANWCEPLRASGLSIGSTWFVIFGAFTACGMGVFLLEIKNFRGPDRIVERISSYLFIFFYLGILPSFFLQLRWRPEQAMLALALTVFVPKGNDIGAYFTGKFLTGRLLGRTPMTPLLSPKKTWQGAVGGMVASVLAAIGIASLGPILPSTWAAIGFGLTVGLAGVLGDLAESLIKRDRETKDASSAVPGFGGVLDVIDSLLFAAPVAYIWLMPP